MGLVLLLSHRDSEAQDPGLPATNLGLTNMLDGTAPPPGFYYQNYTQIYKVKGFYDSESKRTAADLKVNYLLSLHQLIYLSKVRFLKGNLEFTAMLPLVKLSAESDAGKTPAVNPGVMGDMTFGAGIQWSGKKLFNKNFHSRYEMDLTVPSGSSDSRYTINPSARFYTLSTYYAFTYFLNDRFSISTRNQLNYNFNRTGTKSKAGAFYNVNYAIEYTLVKTLRAELAGYYLKQLVQDSFDGNHHYYQDNFRLLNTYERTFAAGSGLSYLTTGGIFMEAKVLFETSAQNRFEGTRTSFRIALPLK